MANSLSSYSSLCLIHFTPAASIRILPLKYVVVFITGPAQA